MTVAVVTVTVARDYNGKFLFKMTPSATKMFDYDDGFRHKGFPKNLPPSPGGATTIAGAAVVVVVVVVVVGLVIVTAVTSDPSAAVTFPL